ncbi:hypothetical protein SAMN05444339_1238 [Loktanella atrilutea]|uniref:Uncharacterized protein n=1 Tax=Loktanella atrilutea TaxID=366533 RepID=A0A1M5FNN7_LOKAT|nr:hypothetical protein [Loktanella atrilutea]SHF93115.1 hypothetical protein SAMN05444339_1238 [Loktanella atrilutea]
MGKLVTGAIGLVIGLVLGAIFGGALKIGAAAGVSAATGIGAGICSTVIAAQEEGLLTPEEVDQELTRAARDMVSITDDLSGEIVGSAAGCKAIIDRLRAAID